MVSQLMPGRCFEENLIPLSDDRIRLDIFTQLFQFVEVLLN